VLISILGILLTSISAHAQATPAHTYQAKNLLGESSKLACKQINQALINYPQIKYNAKPSKCLNDLASAFRGCSLSGSNKNCPEAIRISIKTPDSREWISCSKDTRGRGYYYRSLACENKFKIKKLNYYSLNTLIHSTAQPPSRGGNDHYSTNLNMSNKRKEQSEFHRAFSKITDLSIGAVSTQTTDNLTTYYRFPLRVEVISKYISESGNEILYTKTLGKALILLGKTQARFSD